MTDLAGDPVRIDRRADLAQLFADRAPGSAVRLIGTGSAQRFLPAPAAGRAVTLVSLAGLDRIDRFEPGDLTCSVEPGVPRARLDEELARHGLRLPCAGTGTGTIGGMFAWGEFGPLAPGGQSPRSLLLGLEGVLADGLPFKTGARVVKNVAGFDLPKLFVGSRGRLFAATLLHLKLRPAPRHAAFFENPSLELGEALRLYRALRLRSWPPAALFLSRDSGAGGPGDGFRVHGSLEGTHAVVGAALHEHALCEVRAEPAWQDRPKPPGSSEVLRGFVRPSRLEHLLSALADDTALGLWVTGTGQFQVELRADATDRVLAVLPDLDACAEIFAGAPERRGRGTPIDPGSARLMRELMRRLDPKELLC